MQEPDRETLGAALRELEAAKQRVERDAKAATAEMKKQLVEKLLPVLDDLDRTIVAAELADNAPALLEGARLVRTHFANVLHGFGLERLDAEDLDFDPAVHDAIATTPVPSPALHDTVLEQIAPGYLFGGTLLRPAKVVVGVHRPKPPISIPINRLPI